MSASQESKSLDIHLVTHTHWDREWYSPAEVYRFRLIEVFERLQRIFESDPAYHSFFMDGQTVPLEDLLEARPEMESWVRAQIKSGRLRVGPFYTLLDEQLAGGESFVRNLLIGREIVRRYEGRADVGYLPDDFGHVSQTPQILRGFGLDNAVMWRGLEADKDLPNECRWRAADGSEVFLAVLARGYSSACGMTPDDPASFDRALRAFDRLKQSAAGPVLLLMYGIDHSLPHPETGRVLDMLRQRIPDATLRHSDMESFLAAAVKQVSDRVLQGERIHASHLDATFSSRLLLKQMNRRCEMELTAYAEPLSALASLAGAAWPAEDLRRAWKKLIRCHAHDSITGCHADAVAEDMRVRLRRSGEIASCVSEQALDRLTGCKWTYSDPAALRALAVFNPLPSPRRAVVRTEIFLPPAETVRSIVIRGEGAAHEANILSCEEVAWPQRSDYVIPKSLLHKRYTIEFGPVELRPLGITRFQAEVVAGGAAANILTTVADSGKSKSASLPMLSSQPDVLENAFLRVVVRPDASMDVTDKLTGQRYERLHVIEAEQDAGNLYEFIPTLSRTRYAFAPEKSALIENCSTSASLRVSGALHLPAGLDRDGRPLAETVACPVSATITLKRDDPVIYFRTVIENRARHVCLRARFDTGMAEARSFAHTPFDIVERPPLAEAWTVAGNQRRPVGVTRYACQEFVSLFDGRHSLTLLNRGLPEYTFHAGGVLTLTLLRSTNIIWNYDGPRAFPLREFPAEAALELGSHEREYALLLHDGPIAKFPALRDALAYNRPPRCRWTDHKPEAISLSLEPAALVLTAFKRSEDGKGYVVRLHNVLDVPVEGTLTLPKPFSRILSCRLDETPQEEIGRAGQSVKLTVPPRKIATILLLD